MHRYLNIYSGQQKTRRLWKLAPPPPIAEIRKKAKWREDFSGSEPDQKPWSIIPLPAPKIVESERIISNWPARRFKCLFPWKRKWRLARVTRWHGADDLPRPSSGWLAWQPQLAVTEHDSARMSDRNAFARDSPDNNPRNVVLRLFPFFSEHRASLSASIIL